MMQKVKEQKLEHIKNIKRLTNEKTNLQKKFKDDKDKNSQLTSTLDEKMKKYQILSTNYEESVKALENIDETNLIEIKTLKTKAIQIQSNMTLLLSNVEKDRNEWTKRRELLIKIRERLNEIDDIITDEKAELVAFAGLLDQNDKLRTQIQEEERAKAREIIDNELALARIQLEKEKLSVRGTIEEEIAEEMIILQKSISEYQSRLLIKTEQCDILTNELNTVKSYCDTIEINLANLEVEYEVGQKDIEKLTNDLYELQENQTSNNDNQSNKNNENQLNTQTEDFDNLNSIKSHKNQSNNSEIIEELQLKHSNEIENLKNEMELKYFNDLKQIKIQNENENYILFQNLMNNFDLERKELINKCHNSELLTQQTIKVSLLL